MTDAERRRSHIRRCCDVLLTALPDSSSSASVYRPAAALQGPGSPRLTSRTPSRSGLLITTRRQPATVGRGNFVMPAVLDEIARQAALRHFSSRVPRSRAPVVEHLSTTSTRARSSRLSATPSLLPTSASAFGPRRRAAMRSRESASNCGRAVDPAREPLAPPPACPSIAARSARSSRRRRPVRRSTSSPLRTRCRRCQTGTHGHPGLPPAPCTAP